MTQLAGQVLYTAKTHTNGVLQGRARSSDGRLDVEMTAPGAPGAGTNPEQLLAAGWSACFMLAINLAASRLQVKLPADAAVDAEVDLCNTEGNYDGRFYIQARMSVSLPRLDREVAQKLLDAAHHICPYHEATRGNVEVTVTLV